jgi:hypothetical protein
LPGAVVNGASGRTTVGRRANSYSTAARTLSRARVQKDLENSPWVVGTHRRRASSPQNLSPRFGMPGLGVAEFLFCSGFRGGRSRRPRRGPPFQGGALCAQVRQQKPPFCRSLSPLPDSNRGPPPYHGGFDQPLCDVGKALASALSLHFAWFVCSLHPSLEGP